MLKSAKVRRLAGAGRWAPTWQLQPGLFATSQMPWCATVDLMWTEWKGSNTRLIKFDHNFTTIQNTQKSEFQWIPLNWCWCPSPSSSGRSPFQDCAERAVRAARLDSDDPARSESHRQSRISPGPNISAARIDIRHHKTKKCQINPN